MNPFFCQGDRVRILTFTRYGFTAKPVKQCKTPYTALPLVTVLREDLGPCTVVCVAYRFASRHALFYTVEPLVIAIYIGIALQRQVCPCVIRAVAGSEYSRCGRWQHHAQVADRVIYIIGISHT